MSCPFLHRRRLHQQARLPADSQDLAQAALEMDFFLRSGNDLVPIEVKSENARAKSLRTLIASEHYKDISWGVKLVNSNVGFENQILTLPQWSVFLLPRVLKPRAEGVGPV